jgi:hypothetical protein
MSGGNYRASLSKTEQIETAVKTIGITPLHALRELPEFPALL